MKESAYDCKHLGGLPPLGYDVDPETRHYVINEAEADIVRIIFDKYAHDVGYNQLLAYLNGMGYRSKRGGKFGKNSLYSILQNEKYVGKYVFNKRREKTVAGKRNPTLKPEEEWIVIPDGVPAIVDQETFDIVQYKMKNNRNKAGKYRAKEIYLLSGLVVCGECGESMYGNVRMCGRNRSNYSSYRCSGSAKKSGCKNKEIRRDYLDSYVLDVLRRRLFSKVSLRKITDMLNAYNMKIATETDSQMKRIQSAIDENQRRISNIFKAISETGISSDLAKADLKRLSDEKEVLERRLEELEAERQAGSLSKAMVSELIERSGEFIRTHRYSECRNFIDSYVKRVIVYEDRVKVIFKVKIFDEDSGELTSMKSVISRDKLRRRYKSVPKGGSWAE